MNRTSHIKRGKQTVLFSSFFVLLLIAVFGAVSAAQQFLSFSSSDSLKFVVKENLGEVFPSFAEGFKGLEIEVTSDKPIAPDKEVTGELNKSDKEVTTSYSLRDGITMETRYEDSKNRTLGDSSVPTKQTITFNNLSDEEHHLEVINRTSIDTDKVNWNGEEYEITSSPRSFKAFEKTAPIPELAKDLGQEDLEGIEDFSNVTHTYTVGTFLTYQTPDGKLARFDWSDIASLNHEVLVYKDGDKTVLELKLTELTLPSRGELVIDPDYALSDPANYDIRHDGNALGDALAAYGSVAVGDVNGDGLGDLVIGAPYTDYTGSNAGSA